MGLFLDHLAIAAASLDDRRLDALLGVQLSPGGRHLRMGTHNRLLRLGPTSYLELLAIDPQGTTPAHPRWFELDEPAMKARLASGPRLVHWIARVERTELPGCPSRSGPGSSSSAATSPGS
jgi:Glyoxalase-like domain